MSERAPAVSSGAPGSGDAGTTADAGVTEDAGRTADGAAPLLVVHPDKQVLADAAAARLLTAILDAQARRGTVDLVLTGGSMGSAILSSLGATPGHEALDWSRVSLWWGDERFVPAGDPDRNETKAREALLDSVPLDPANVHAMAPSDGPYADVDAAADGYAKDLAAAAGPGQEVPDLDIVMLGVGPDAHIASLFPEHPALHDQRGSTVGVHGSPKPPPLRVSLTFDALRSAREVWFLVSGEDKAGAVGLALSGAGELQAPAGAVRGRLATLWLLDAAAASKVPARN